MAKPVVLSDPRWTGSVQRTKVLEEVPMAKKKTVVNARTRDMVAVADGKAQEEIVRKVLSRYREGR